jgi:hypothetical protein
MQVSTSFSSIMNSTKSAFTSVTSSQFHQKPKSHLFHDYICNPGHIIHLSPEP